MVPHSNLYSALFCINLDRDCIFLDRDCVISSNDLDPLGMKYWVKKYRKAKVLSEGNENIKWVMREGSDKCHLQPHAQLQK